MTAALARLLDALADRVWWVLAAVSAGFGLLHRGLWSGAGWHWFVAGAHVLFSSAGLHLYATHNELQIGPLALVAVAPLVFGLPAHAAQTVAMVLMSLAGLAVLDQVRRLVPNRDRDADRAFLLAGLCLVPVWAELAVTYSHPDDVLALLLSLVALNALRAGRPAAAAVLLALAIDCKPWALAFVPALLLVEHRDRARAWLVLTATVLAGWLPFFVADPRTFSAATFGIRTSLASSLRVLGVHAGTTPLWDRPGQLALGAALAAVAVARGRWPAVILVAVAARLLLDPATKSYYDAGLLAGAVLCDLVLSRRRVPWLSVSAVVAFYLPAYLLQADPRVYGLVRTGYLVALIAVVLGSAALVRRGGRVQVRDVSGQDGSAGCVGFERETAVAPFGTPLHVGQTAAALTTMCARRLGIRS